MGRTPKPHSERGSMFWVIVLIIAAVIVGALFLVRGRRAA
jgi:hypothetical protein